MIRVTGEGGSKTTHLSASPPQVASPAPTVRDRCQDLRSSLFCPPRNADDHVAVAMALGRAEPRELITHS